MSNSLWTTDKFLELLRECPLSKTASTLSHVGNIVENFPELVNEELLSEAAYCAGSFYEKNHETKIWHGIGKILFVTDDNLIRSVFDDARRNAHDQDPEVRLCALTTMLPFIVCRQRMFADAELVKDLAETMNYDHGNGVRDLAILSLREIFSQSKDMACVFMDMMLEMEPDAVMMVSRYVAHNAKRRAEASGDKNSKRPQHRRAGCRPELLVTAP